MRIIGGAAAGRVIEVPKGLSVRPTPDKVRQAIFNSLGGRVEGADVLELFGGSGALSLECLSRGATSAACVEKSAKHAQFIRGNFRKIGLQGAKFNVIVGDVFGSFNDFFEKDQRFDLIIADPPFGDKNVNRRSISFSQRLLDDSMLPQLMNLESLLVLGHAKRDQLEIPSHWYERKVLKHGDSIFRMLTPVVFDREQPLLESGS